MVTINNSPAIPENWQQFFSQKNTKSTKNKLASLEATLVQNYYRVTDLLTDGGEV